MIKRVIGEHIELKEDLADGLGAVIVDRAQLQHVLINLSINARDAMPGGGTLTMRTSERELGERDVARGVVSAPGRYLLLEIADTGTGMDETARAKAFEPFFTTKSDGTGLGLATVYGIVHQSGGHIALHTKPGEGTRFEILLPTTAAGSSATAPARDRDSAALKGDETILHVEDSETLRPIVVKALERYGYTVLSAGNAVEAQRLADEHPGQIDLVLTDVMMPGLNGRELAEVLTAKYPGMKVLFTSGYPSDVVLRDGIAVAEFNFIEKPFVGRELVKVVREVLES
jgi:CheY-like chemotaxis protein